MRTEQRAVGDSTVPCTQLTPKDAVLVADAGIGTLACPLAVPPVENPMPREAEVPQFQVILIEVDDVRATTLGSHLICGAGGGAGACEAVAACFRSDQGVQCASLGPMSCGGPDQFFAASVAHLGIGMHR